MAPDTDLRPAVVLDLDAVRPVPAAPRSARLRRLGRLQAVDLRASAAVHAVAAGSRRGA